MPEERRRHLSAAGGLPLALLEEARYSSRRFRKLRGLDALKAVARAVAVDRLDLGFVDILSTEGSLDHPLSGPREELFWRRELLASTEPPRSRFPVVDSGGGGQCRGQRSPSSSGRCRPDPAAVAAILDQIGLGPNGTPVGLRGLRLQHLPAVRRGGGGGTGVAAAVRAVPGAAGGGGAAAGGGGLS